MTLLLFVIAAIVFGPFLNLWALNTLFGFGIAYTLKTWFASLVLGALVYGASSKTTKVK